MHGPAKATPFVITRHSRVLLEVFGLPFRLCMHHGLLPVENQSPREALRLYVYQELKGGYQTFSKHACGEKSILAPLQHFMFELGCLFSATLLMWKYVPIRLARVHNSVQARSLHPGYASANWSLLLDLQWQRPRNCSRSSWTVLPISDLKTPARGNAAQQPRMLSGHM